MIKQYQTEIIITGFVVMVAIGWVAAWIDIIKGVWNEKEVYQGETVAEHQDKQG